MNKYGADWKLPENDIYRSLAMLGHINILRKGNSNTGFDKCGARIY